MIDHDMTALVHAPTAIMTALVVALVVGLFVGFIAGAWSGGAGRVWSIVFAPWVEGRKR